MNDSRDPAAPPAERPSSERGPAAFEEALTQCPNLSEALRRREFWPCVVAETAPDGIVIADSSGTIIYWNAAAERMYGYARREVVGRNLVDLLVPLEQRPQVVEELREFAVSGRTFSVGRVTARDGLRKDGGRFPVEMSVAALRFEGQWWGIAIVRDVADRRHAEDLTRIQRDLGTALSATARLSDALRLCLETAMRVSLMDSGGIYLVNAGGSLDLAVHAGLSDAFVRQVAHFAPDSMHADLVRRSLSVFATREEMASFGQGAIAEEGLLCLGGLPVRHEGRAIAWMNVASHALEEAPAAARGALEAIASQIGTAILRIRAEEARAASEARLRNLFEHIPDMVFVVDPGNKILYMNHAVAGVPREKMIGTLGFQHVVAADQPMSRVAFERAMASGEVQSLEVLDVYGIWWECRVVPLMDDGSADRAMVICTDVTARKKAEEQLREEHRRLRQMVDMYERAHAVAAIEIHDAIEQPLTAAQMSFEGQVAEARREQPDRPWPDFDPAIGLLRAAIGEARRLMSGLRPSALDDFGLEEALTAAAHVGPPDGWEVEIAYDVQCLRLEPALETAIFRIVQEGLNNARRHSRSREVRVAVIQRGEVLWVEVEDAGVGFNPHQVGPGRLGLEGIRTRAEAFGGRAEVRSAPGQGTQILVRLPVLEAPPDAPAPESR